MADETGSEEKYLSSDLTENAKRYNYFQVIRLIKLIGYRDGKSNEKLSIRPDLSLNFPGSDIESIGLLSSDEYHLVVNFFGLYGVSSPLPALYTEELMAAEASGSYTAREFLDIVHEVLYPLLFDAWSRHRLHIRAFELRDTQALKLLNTFIGLRENTSRGNISSSIRGKLLAAAGLICKRGRTTSGLRSLVSTLVYGAKVEIFTCIKRVMQIPIEQQWFLGIPNTDLCTITYLGSEVEDYGSRVEIYLFVDKYTQYTSLYPQQDMYLVLMELIRIYVGDLTDVNVKVTLTSSKISTVSLGCEQWSFLGYDTWLSPPGNIKTGVLQYRVL